MVSLPPPKTWQNSSILQDLQNFKKFCRALISTGSKFYQAGTEAKNALALVNARQTSFRLGTAKWCWSSGHIYRETDPQVCWSLAT